MIGLRPTLDMRSTRRRPISKHAKCFSKQCKQNEISSVQLKLNLCQFDFIIYEYNLQTLDFCFHWKKISIGLDNWASFLFSEFLSLFRISFSFPNFFLFANYFLTSENSAATTVHKTTNNKYWLPQFSLLLKRYFIFACNNVFTTVVY